MADKIKLVQGDTLPTICVVISDELTGEPIDISGCDVEMKFREAGSTSVKSILLGELQPGIKVGSLTNTDPPYNTPGKGGIVFFEWGAGDLDTDGAFEGEISVTLADGRVHTVYDNVKFIVREEF